MDKIFYLKCKKYAENKNQNVSGTSSERTMSCA